MAIQTSPVQRHAVTSQPRKGLRHELRAVKVVTHRVLCLAGLAGVPYSPTLVLTLLAEMAVGAFAITEFGLMMAAEITKLQGFGGLTQMAMMPMMSLSGALFPLANLPGWLAVLTRINPLTYAVDPLRGDPRPDPRP